MSNKMLVLFAKLTGHVLAAFTRAADPEGKPSISDLTGAGLLVRNKTGVSATLTGGEVLVVPPESLEVAVVDFDPDVFSDPRSFVAGGGTVSKQGPTSTAQLASPTISPPPASPSPSTALVPPGSPPLVNFSNARVTVQVDANVTDDKGVIAILEEAQPLPGDAPERRTAQGVIKSGDYFVSLDLKTGPDGSLASISNKQFFILALIAGYQPLFGTRLPAP